MLLSIRKLCVYDTNPPRSVNKKLTLRQIFVDGASAIFDTQKHPHRLTGVEILPLAFSVPLQMTRQ